MTTYSREERLRRATALTKGMWDFVQVAGNLRRRLCRMAQIWFLLPTPVCVPLTDSFGTQRISTHFAARTALEPEETEPNSQNRSSLAQPQYGMLLEPRRDDCGVRRLTFIRPSGGVVSHDLFAVSYCWLLKEGDAIRQKRDATEVRSGFLISIVTRTQALFCFSFTELSRRILLSRLVGPKVTVSLARPQRGVLIRVRWVCASPSPQEERGPPASTWYPIGRWSFCFAACLSARKDGPSTTVFWGSEKLSLVC